jgi:hypothetical protein
MSVNAFHEKAGRGQVSCFVFSLDKVLSPCRVSHCRHASIRTLEERFVRSVQVGRSRFSRCCHLFIGLFSLDLKKVAQAINAVTGTRL